MTTFRKNGTNTTTSNKTQKKNEKKRNDNMKSEKTDRLALSVFCWFDVAGLAENLGSQRLILLHLPDLRQEDPKAQRDDVGLKTGGLVAEEASPGGVAGHDRRDEHARCHKRPGHQLEHRHQDLLEGQDNRRSRCRLPAHLQPVLIHHRRCAVVLCGGAGGWVPGCSASCRVGGGEQGGGLGCCRVLRSGTSLATSN